MKELQSQVIQTPEQQAWLAKLLGYDFPIEYKAGTDNQGADGLSRAFMSITALTSSWIPILQQELQHLKPFDEFIAAELKTGHLTIRKGLWFWKDKLFIPANSAIKKQLLQEFCDSLLGGHCGYQKTLARLLAQFFWKNMANMVKAYIRACSICQQAKYNNLPPAGLLQPLPIPNKIWHDIAMDFITGLPLSHGYSVILVIIDRLSKFAHFLPLQTDFSTPKVVDVFIKEVVSIHGIPQTIVSDRDKVFTSKFWEQI